MWYNYTMEYHSDIKNNEFIKLLGKWLELENIILNKVTQLQKNTHGISPESRNPKTHFTYQMMPKEEERRMNTVERRTKYP